MFVSRKSNIFNSFPSVNPKAVMVIGAVAMIVVLAGRVIGLQAKRIQELTKEKRDGDSAQISAVQ